MNKKLISKIAVTLCVAVLGFVYTTTMSARITPSKHNTSHHTSKSGAKSVPKELQNLEACATEKNPKYLAHILVGAFAAYDKDVIKPLKTGNHRELTKAKESLAHTIKFLLTESRHLKPIFKHEEHNKAFLDALKTEIDKLVRKEFKEAKDAKTQGVVMHDWRAVANDLKKAGIHVTIPNPAKEAKMKAKAAKKAAAAKRKAEARRKAEEKRRKAEAAAAAAAAAQEQEDDSADAGDADIDTGDEEVSDDADDADVDTGDEEVSDDADDADVDTGDEEVSDDAGDADVDTGDEEVSDDADVDVDTGDEEVSDDAGDADVDTGDEAYTEED
jgi:hypothetical protein